MQRPDDDPRESGASNTPPGKHPLADYGKLTGIRKGFLSGIFTNWLEIVEGVLVLILSLAAAAHLVNATIVPEGELGFGGLIFLIPILLVAVVIAALPLTLLRGWLANALPLRLLANIGLAAAVAFGVLGVELRPKKAVTPLHGAAEAGEILAPDPLPDAAALETRDARGMTPLALAVRRAAQVQPTDMGRIALVKQLLARGANVNTRDIEDRTPLFYAMDHPELLDLLVAHGADPNLPYSQMGTGYPCHSLWYWVGRKNPEQIIAVAERFPGLAVPRGPDGRPVASPLYDATSHTEQPSVVRYFLQRGFAPNAADRECTFSRTPLHNVVLWPEPEAREAIDLLLAAGADIDARARRGETPLMGAGSRPGTVRYLIERGADINAVDESDGLSVLDKFEKWHREESARLLREAGALTGKELRKAALRSRAGR